MIGQHIYSRCLEGYFSKSLTADSTTVTISADMFAREEQAKIVARECEKISVLEDIREVPSEVQGAYRGALKIRRLNRQLTVVCRSYRLHSEQSGSGETRDFTYGSSYILTGEDRERFLEKPEYFLNIRNFEPYPSVMKRIRESREMGKNGKIEASTEFSLFEGECPEASPEVFRQAGFTRELFIDYISGIIQRVSYSHYEGHERDKVLLVLPQRFNVPWVKSGGNRYAEEVLAATMRILPSGVREQLSAMVGGMDDADAAVLDGYQLVFMEAGNSQNWRKSEYTVIDLDRQESFVPEMTDNRYGEFLWDYLMEEETRRNFERQYVALFGKEKNADGDNSPEKYAFVMELLQEAARDFADDRKRTGLLLGLMGYCSDDWSENARNLFCRVLEKENSEPQYDKEIERTLLNLLQEGMCPQEAQEQAVNCILNSIYRGDAEEASIQWVCEGVREGETVIVKQVKRMNALVDSDSETQWYKRKSLLDFYYNVCGDSDILAGKEVKKEILSILSEWYISFLEKEDWENCAMITRILSEAAGRPASGKRRKKGHLSGPALYSVLRRGNRKRPHYGDSQEGGAQVSVRAGTCGTVLGKFSEICGIRRYLHQR